MDIQWANISMIALALCLPDRQQNKICLHKAFTSGLAANTTVRLLWTMEKVMCLYLLSYYMHVVFLMTNHSVHGCMPHAVAAIHSYHVHSHQLPEKMQQYCCICKCHKVCPI